MIKNNKKTGITAVIITHNEEENIKPAIESISWCDSIIVVDCESDDKTVQIAEWLGAKVYTRKWKGYVDQKNWANSQVKTEWILSLDADERVSPDLRKEIEEELKHPAYDGYKIPRLACFLGRNIKHCHWYPDYQLRLFRKSKAEWAGGKVHETVKVNGSIGRLKKDILHYTYKDIADQTNRLNHYSTLWAEEAFKQGRKVNLLSVILAPAATFINVYIFRLGFLEGFPGLVISRALAYYSFQKKAKLLQMRKENRNDGT
ncbi:MAG: glycosyltransferase family 2 protein [Acidobacteria bacterium]|nr:glycosyltransferase family 2 protein [Acidobacteriota bacterium]